MMVNPNFDYLINHLVRIKTPDLNQRMLKMVAWGLLFSLSGKEVINYIYYAI